MRILGQCALSFLSPEKRSARSRSLIEPQAMEGGLLERDPGPSISSHICTEEERYHKISIAHSKHPLYPPYHHPTRDQEPYRLLPAPKRTRRIAFHRTTCILSCIFLPAFYSGVLVLSVRVATAVAILFSFGLFTSGEPVWFQGLWDTRACRTHFFCSY